MNTVSPGVFRFARLPIRLVSFAAMLLIVSCGENSSETGVIELQIGTVTAPGSLVSASSEEFARRINERLEGRVRVDFFGSSQLGNDEVLVQKLKLGTLRLRRPVDDHVFVGRRIRVVRDAVPGTGSRSHATHRRGDLLAVAGTGGRGRRLPGPWAMGERVPAYHQQHPPHLHAGGPQRDQAANAAGGVAVQAVPCVWS